MSRSELDSPQSIATFQKTRVVAAQWIVGSVIGFFGFAYAFAHVRALIRGTSLEPIILPVFTPPDALVWLAITAGLVALVVVPHELLHGVCMAYYGEDPSYGVAISHFVLPYAYAETTGSQYTRNQLLVILLAPFVGITAVGLAVMAVYPSPLLIIPLAANAAGSIGDLWMAGILVQYSPDVRVAPPHGDVQGFGIYGSSRSEGQRQPWARFVSRAISGGVGTIGLIVTALVGTVFLSLAVDTGTVVIGDPGSRWLLVRHEFDPGSGTVLLEIGATLLLAVGAVGGLGWATLVESYRTLTQSA